MWPRVSAKIYVVADNGTEKEYQVPRGVHINVQEGERIRAGEPLMDGPLNPHDILAVLGEKELQSYLVNEIQEVYRLQGVNISDKHIEVIVRQMMRWVKVEDVGDTPFLLEQQIDKFRFREENEKAIANGGKPATGRPLLLGITKASLSTDSFISAASFQETTRVLTEASIQGAVDHLRGLKENVIVGRLIPRAPAWSITAMSGSRRRWKRLPRRCRRRSRPRTKKPNARWNCYVTKAKTKPRSWRWSKVRAGLRRSVQRNNNGHRGRDLGGRFSFGGRSRPARCFSSSVNRWRAEPSPYTNLA